MAELPSIGSQDRCPLIDYAKRHCWGNPQLNQQFQIRLARVSPDLGYSKNFDYMGKYYLTPIAADTYNVFTLGGLNVGAFGLGTRVFSWAPFDRWVNASEYLKKRGVMLDFYNESGLMYNRTDTWIMKCFNGATFVAFLRNKERYPMPVDKPMYMRCYSPDIPKDTSLGYTEEYAKFEVYGVTYYDVRKWRELISEYNKLAQRTYGRLTTWHNGVIRPFNDIDPKPYDLIEVVFDPTIERVLTFNYSNLKTYQSTRDNKTKVIIFPWFEGTNRRYYFFDDCEFYVKNRKTNKSMYLHRNHQDCVRQLTHQDYGVAGDYILTAAEYLIADDTTGSSTISDIDIVVTYHRSTWNLNLGPTSSRIADLYLLNDPDAILGAMTGPNATIIEWQAPVLEDSAHAHLLWTECTDITNELVYDALGYNGCSMVLSTELFYMPGVTPGDAGFEDLYDTPPYTSGLGYQVPPSYIVNSTIYEYDRDGYWLRKVIRTWSEHYPPSKDAVFCEYTLGAASDKVDATLVKDDYKVSEDYSFRVYRAPWKDDEASINPGETLIANKTDVVREIARDTIEGTATGSWVDITDNESYYTFDKETGYISWKPSMSGAMGLVVTDAKHVFYQVVVDHIDNSLSFDISSPWNISGQVLPLRPAQLDIWMDGNSLIWNVDYKLDFPTVYIVNKQLLKEDATSYTFTIRGIGLSSDGPYERSELGFVTDGVLGHNGRYNLRINRPTKTICDGRVFLTHAIDWAETPGHGNNFSGLEGYPYEVKHYVSLNKYVENYTTQKGLEEDHERDIRIADYLKAHISGSETFISKPLVQYDRYMVFSPFMSQLYNEMYLGFLPIPKGEITDQVVTQMCANFLYLLKYDPCVLNYDKTYFVVHPCSNVGYQPITARQLQVLDRANALYLNNRIRVRSHFEVVDE